MRPYTNQDSKEKSPLTPEQKKTVLSQLFQKVQSPEIERAIIEQLHNDVKANNAHGYPPLLADMVTKLNGPYQLLTSPEEITLYNMVVTSYLQKNAGRIFRESCISKEEWGHMKVHLLSEKFNIRFQSAHSIKFTIFKGKLHWQIFYEENMVAFQHQFPHGIQLQTIDMTVIEFTEFKNAGKRNGSKYPYHSFVHQGQQHSTPFYKNTRSPKKGSILNHDNTDLCHICVWDVEKYADLKLHRRQRHAEEAKNGVTQSRLCCGKEYPLDLDHIPAQSFLKEMREIYPAQEAVFQSDQGYVIALSKVLHDNISATMKDKAKKRDFKSEAKNPSSTLLIDISAYFEFFQAYEKMTLTILGAFRYIYRKNVKRFQSFYNHNLDELFLKAISIYLNSRQNYQKDSSHKNPIQQRGGTLFSNVELIEVNNSSVTQNPQNSNHALGI